MGARALAAIALAVAILGAALGCGGSAETTIRIGVLVDCGPFAGFREPVLAGVEAPFLARGARPAGALPSAGLRDAEVGGHPVDILDGCVYFDAANSYVEQARRLVEQEGADIVLGTAGVPEGIALRNIAVREPGATFVVGFSGAMGATFPDVPANLFRYGATAAQAVSGLAAYAYRDLGWRTAAIVEDQYPGSWEYDAAFTAEFCALGGRIVHRDVTSLTSPTPLPAEVAAARDADGVAILSLVGSLAPLSQDGYVSAFLAGRDVPASRAVVAGGITFADPAKFDWARDPNGVVVASSVPFAPNAAGARLAETVAAAFPGFPPGLTGTEFVARHAEAAAAVAQALEAVDGDLSDGQRAFRDALSRLTLHSPDGTVRLDENHQGIVTTYLGRVSRAAGAAPVVAPFREVRGIDQTLGGLLRTVPVEKPVGCVSRRSSR